MLNTESGAKVPVRETQVYSELGRLSEVVCKYADHLKFLEDRVTPIRVSRPTTEEDKREVHDRLVPLAEEIRTIREKVEDLNIDLVALISELEI